MKKSLLFFVLMLTFCSTLCARDGVYVEFKMSGGKFSGTSKVYSCDGNTRSEMNIVTPAMPNPIATVSLILKDAPEKIFTLNEKDKTYSEMEINKDRISHNSDVEYEVTVIGKEKINNYNCVHVKVKSKGSRDERDMWLSKDVAAWENYTSIKNKYLAGTKLFDALKAKGAEGFFVRLVMQGPNGEQMQMDLVKAEHRNIDESLLTLAGYTKKAAGAPGAGFGGVDVDAIQKMTPEERQKYIDDMKAKYQQQQH